MSDEHALEISCKPEAAGWHCRVRVGTDAAATIHDVTLSRADLARLAPGGASPESLVRASFVFLLQREPRESILRHFELPLIGRYFPEWERTIRR